jgi:hypothetical protein
LQVLFDNFHQKRSYKFRFSSECLSPSGLETRMRAFRVSFQLRQVVLDGRTITCRYDVWGSSSSLRVFSDFFVNSGDVLAMEY